MINSKINNIFCNYIFNIFVYDALIYAEYSND